MLVWLLSRKAIVSTVGLCVCFRLNAIQGSRKVMIIFWNILAITGNIVYIGESLLGYKSAEYERILSGSIIN